MDNRAMKLKFLARSPQGKPNVIEARYDCDCGCKPRARYERGTELGGHEHCCCGKVHFVGINAEKQLKEYLAQRSEQGLDNDVGGYTLYNEQIAAPWGESIPIAYALPNQPRKH